MGSGKKAFILTLDEITPVIAETMLSSGLDSLVRKYAPAEIRRDNSIRYAVLHYEYGNRYFTFAADSLGFSDPYDGASYSGIGSDLDERIDFSRNVQLVITTKERKDDIINAYAAKEFDVQEVKPKVLFTGSSNDDAYRRIQQAGLYEITALFDGGEDHMDTKEVAARTDAAVKSCLYDAFVIAHNNGAGHFAAEKIPAAMGYRTIVVINDSMVIEDTVTMKYRRSGINQYSNRMDILTILSAAIRS